MHLRQKGSSIPSLQLYNPTISKNSYSSSSPSGQQQLRILAETSSRAQEHRQAVMEAETREQTQARHRRELKGLQDIITNKKKNASKKTRKSVSDECAEMKRRLGERQAAEVAALDGGAAQGQEEDEDEGSEVDESTTAPPQSETSARGLRKLGNAAEEALGTAAAMSDDDNDSSNYDGASGSQQPQASKKKRNRQKERLARRAAAHEAAAQRAEAEASSMPDRRARERAYMEQAIAARRLVEWDVAPDGHCLFSAVADQLGHHAVVALGAHPGEPPAHSTVRRAAAEYMAAHAEDFAPFLGAAAEEHQEDFGVYVQRMRDTAAWGGQLELTALARRYGVEIRVIQDGRTEAIGEEEGKASGKTLWLAYYRHGYGLGEHYNSLRNAEATTTATTATTTS